MKNFLELAEEEKQRMKDEEMRRMKTFVKSFPKLHYALENTQGLNWSLEEGSGIWAYYNHSSVRIKGIYDFTEEELIDQILDQLFL